MAALAAVAATVAVAAPAPAPAPSADLVRTAARFEVARRGADLPGALLLGRRALELADADPVNGAPQRVDLLIGLAALDERRGEFVAALTALQRALVLNEQELGREHPDLVQLLTQIAALQQRVGRLPDAESSLQRALSILRATYGPRHLRVRETLLPLQALYVAAGRPTDAAQVAADIEALDRSTRDAQSVSIPVETRSRRYTQRNGSAAVRVFYGTNRAPTGERSASSFYGSSRGDLQYGYADVTIPETHKEGELESPSRWTVLTLDLDSDAARRRFVLLQSLRPLARDRFLETLRAQISRSPSRELLVFVHGYNNSFEEASRRVAQLVYDLDFDGTPVMFSWPSAGSTTGYTVDEATVGVSGRRLADFLQTVATDAGASRVHLIAHSMGNRALLDALPRYLATRTAARPGSPLGQIVFTAPDVDRDLFIETVRELAGVGERLTLYASNGDNALRTSALLHGAPRAGLAGSRLIKLAGLDSIDMSAVTTDLMGHSYFAANTGAMYDLFRLLWRGDPPPRRCGMLAHQGADAARAWTFNAKDCSGHEILLAGLLFKRFGNLANGLVRARLLAVKEPEQKDEWQRILARLNDVLKTAVVP